MNPYTYSVAPLTVLPLKKTQFSYKYDEKLLPGALVTVPFSGRTLQGIVISESSPKEIEKVTRLKSIISTEGTLPLTSRQLILAQEVSEMTFTPLGKVLKHFAPKKASVRKKSGAPSAKNPLPFPHSQDVDSAITLLEKTETLFLPLSSHEKSLETLGALVQKLIKGSKQILVLVPDINTAVRLESAWEPHFPFGRIASLYHTKTPGQYFEAWQKIQSNQANIIIATRHGQFAPFQDLGAIVQLDPNDEAYKQWDMSPRYHTHFTLPILQKLWGAKLIATGPLPTLAVLKDSLPMLPLPKFAVTPKWINLKIERWQKNWSAFSLPLQTAMKETLAEKKQIILYIHQSGLESFSVCTECRTIFRCPSCGNALKLSASDHYQCKRCSFRSSLFPACPACKNIHFKSVGYGTEKIGREAAKLFPGASAVIADKKHFGNHKKFFEFLSQASSKEPDIWVTTATFMRFPPLSRIGLVAIIDADTLLNLPGYRKDEQFIELIERSKGLLGEKGEIFVQTFHPESDIFQKIANEDSLSLLQRLLEERSLLRYPPFYRALIIEARPTKKDGGKLLILTTKKLKDFIARHPAKKSLLLQSATRIERGKPKSYTLLRYQPPLHPDITEFLTNHADTVFIDHDPLNLT